MMRIHIHSCAGAGTRHRRQTRNDARRPEDADPAFVPDPCVLDPERVTEYPTYDLPDDVWSQIDETLKRIEADTGWQYDDLAVASGTKTGGYPGWTQPPDWPVCRCGTQMEHLLTVACQTRCCSRSCTSVRVPRCLAVCGSLFS